MAEGEADLPPAPTDVMNVDPVWDNWETPPRVPSIPELHVDGFDGPLDLLLDLAERQQIDLGRLSALELITQFVAAMQRLAGRVTLERRADWLVLAARLLLLRSRLMFPASPAEAATAEQDAAAEELRLGEMLRMRAAATWMEARPQLGQEVFARPRQKQDGRTETTMALLEACLVVLRGPRSRPETAPLYRPMPMQFWRVDQALARIRMVLAANPSGGVLEIFLPEPGLEPETGQGGNRTKQARGALAGTFVACLEMAKQGEIDADQDSLFDPIRISLPQPALQLAQAS
ncbi:segregation/condensation protein A (plasmid) [Lichenicola cladoniae]|uniref:Segregation and condensation protein A n=1 Tax=Lichenicola cladoniae TaxID=1484109 RepID=A0A6M8HZI3_9PROT|nr:segregation/condensation protein A [Lichenicola cladoniae]NPD70006.1 segregation/condensation protein A [Acetobacteraceae bacterium]QKE93627.1 segregation/condensation protein A [Lichenicola cladoniae]